MLCNNTTQVVLVVLFEVYVELCELRDDKVARFTRYEFAPPRCWLLVAVSGTIRRYTLVTFYGADGLL